MVKLTNSTKKISKIIIKTKVTIYNHSNNLLETQYNF